jgi:hypothetical protein
LHTTRLIAAIAFATMIRPAPAARRISICAGAGVVAPVIRRDDGLPTNSSEQPISTGLGGRLRSAGETGGRSRRLTG